MTLRRATLEDASSIAAISIEVWIGTYLKNGVSAVFADYALAEFTSQKTRDLLRDPGQLTFVSENAEGIDGFIRLTFECDAPGQVASQTEIATFYVQPRHHGKGVGRRLLGAAIDECRVRGLSSVWLTTNAENDPAIAFYLAKGFEKTGETYFEIEGSRYLNNVYVRLF